VRLALSIFASALLALTALAPGAGADPSEYGIESVSTEASTNQAGGHPDFTVSFALKRESGGELPATTRDISIDLPPGLLGNPNAVPKCSAAQLVSTDINDETNQTGCPQASQIGVSDVELFKNGSLVPLSEPVYNMESPGGDAVARFGFIADFYPIFIDAHLRSDDDYGVTVTVDGASALAPLLSSSTTIWGVPASEAHDTQRITAYEAVHCNGVPCTAPGGVRRPSGLVPAPFVVNPTRCGVAREVRVTAVSYALPGSPATKSAPLPPISGCGQLGFEPKLTATPTSHETASPSGLDVTVTVPQDETVNGFATSQIEDARVQLPRGMTIASGAADGLAACDAAQAGYKSRQPAHCPEAAKLATAQIDVPELPRPLRAAVYQRSPEAGHLFRIWLIADDLGAHLALPGDLEVDKQNGQISSLFLDLPQAPLRELELHFFGGARGPLATPDACGAYSTHFEFTPWSGGSPVGGDAPMQIDEGCDAGGFSPHLAAGSANPLAGAFAPFVTELTREADEQNISQVEITLPRGVLAKLAGVALCGGADAVSGDCPAASRVGGAVVASGPGPSPLWLPQPGREPITVYLAGRYGRAPYSLVVRALAQAGPFDLGTVVNRVGLYVSPTTAQVTARTDPLPQMLEGVPVTYRTIHVDIDRPSFAVNPTSCEQALVKANLTSSRGTAAAASSRFQVGGCAGLGFGPSLSMRLTGATDRGAHPALRAVLKTRPRDANIAAAQVALPHSEFLEQAHIRTICTRVQFAADTCPSGSVYGHAKAFTPLLARPLEGPVYLRSSSHTLPDLVVALRGQVDFDLVGRIDSVRGGLRTTFARTPDAAVTKFVLTMQGGAKGLLVNSRNLCQAQSRSTVLLDGQNGKSIERHPLLQNDCSGSSGRGKRTSRTESR
jgi:hypothetical protein